MEKFISRNEDSEDDFRGELSAQPDILEFKWRLLSNDANTISVHLQSFDDRAEDESEEIKQSPFWEQSPVLKIFCDTWSLIEDCNIEMIREQIFSSFRSSDDELFKIMPKNVENIKELDNNNQGNFSNIRPFIKNDVRRMFEKLDCVTIIYVSKYWN